MKPVTIIIFFFLTGCTTTLPVPLWGDQEGQFGSIKIQFTQPLEPTPTPK